MKWNQILPGAAAFVLSTALASSAAAATPPPGAISRPPPAAGTFPGNNNQTALPGNTANGTLPQNGNGGVTFTNATGTVFSATDLAQGLRALQGDVDRLLPVLTAFNQQYGKTGNQGLTGILSKILNNRTNSTGGTSQTMSNVVVGISQLLNTNGSSQGATVSAETVRDLEQLEAQLKPVPGMLQALNVPNAVPPQGSIGSYPNSTNNPNGYNGGLTPTGR